MVSAGVLQVVIVALMASAVPANGENHLMTTPQSPVLEIGSTFTATCVIINTIEVTADDLYWNVSKTTVPKEQYTKINSSALNVTLSITNETPDWLFCLSKKKSPYVALNTGKFIHGIRLWKGYPPEKPENLSCLAVQDKEKISAVIKCKWDPVGRQTEDVPTTYTVFVRTLVSVSNNSTQKNYVEVNTNVFQHHMNMEIWVEAHNKLGTAESDRLVIPADFLVKLDSPSHVEAIAEKDFPSSLLLRWTQNIGKMYVTLQYEIRFCPERAHEWTYVPLAEIANEVTSFRLQNLLPNTVYVIQMRCRHSKVPIDVGYWSDWSGNTTKRTPEDRPTSKPDLWAITAQGNSTSQRRVWFLCKDPVSANGKITTFNITIQGITSREQISDSVSVNRTPSEKRKITVLREIDLSKEESVRVDVTASNSVGASPATSLGIPKKKKEHGPVSELKVWPHGNQLWLEWKPPIKTDVSEYVVHWVTGDQIDWQRESRTTTRTSIKDKLEKFVCYNVSVYPIYHGWIGKPATVEAYLEQGAPLEGPPVRLIGKPNNDRVDLSWTEIPLQRRQGFITNYTIFYSNGTKTHNITVPGNIYSYTLRSLSGNTKYDVWIRASTIGGSANGFNHSFTTSKYATGQIELIVVLVSLGFLFVVVMTMLLCMYKKDVIQKNLWPEIPNPGESTIGNWSPDYPLKAETPMEPCLSGISVLDVDVCDGKCVFEEEKANHPLRKDKYLSEEHSSGIGGSSCMSTPRQSVSDNDDSGDLADTTASTVQYSSVVASGGYKGQTPSSQPQQSIFARSESTQPLLDSEENPDMLLQEGSRQSAHFTRQPCFTSAAAETNSTSTAEFKQLEMEDLEALDFCPLEEDNEQTTPTNDQSAAWLQAAPNSSYMPQLGGYRPQ